MNALKQFLAALNNPFGMKLSGNEKLVLLHLNNAMNTAHWAETLPLADSSLLALLNQYDSTGKPMSLESLRRIKQKLKGKGLIDFSSGKGSQISEYRLVKLYTENEPCPHPEDTPDNTPEELLAEKYYFKTNSSENVKTKNIKKIRERAKYFPHLQFDEELWLWWESDCLDDELENEELVHYSEMQSKYGVKKLKVAMEEAFGTYRRKTGWLAVQRILEKSKGGEVKNGRSGDGNRKNAWDD